MGLSEITSSHRCNTVEQSLLTRSLSGPIHSPFIPLIGEAFEFHRSNTVEVLLLWVCPKVYQLIGVAPLSSTHSRCLSEYVSQTLYILSKAKALKFHRCNTVEQLVISVCPQTTHRCNI
jgi:hypothetical protein